MPCPARLALTLLPLLPLLPREAAAQTPPAIAAERADYARWLETSPVSPYAAIYHQPFDGELVFGPAGDPVLADLPHATLHQSLLRLTLETTDGTRTMPRNRDVALGTWRIRVNGDRSHASVTVFGPLPQVTVPGWYDYAPDDVTEGTLEPPSHPESRRMLGLDGVEVEAQLAGTFTTRLGGEAVKLLVYRMPEPGTEESDLMIFFRDASSSHGTYPAGRFLALDPLGGNRYRADFNRARNPFCGYNGIFPCPLPWQGNAIRQALEVGERYGK
jgi:hypothetical protein